MEFRTQSQLRIMPLNEPARVNIVIEKVDLDALKRAALELDTTSAEIIRVLIHEFVTKREKD